MPKKRIVPDHGLCPRCRGEHDHLLDTGGREYVACTSCEVAWLNPAPRPLPSSPNVVEIAEAMLEIATYETVEPVFAPIVVEVPPDEE